MKATINKMAVKILTLPLLFLGVAIVLHQLGAAPAPGASSKVWGVILFVLSIAFGAALPIPVRTSFHKRFVESKKVTEEEFLQRERLLLIFSAISLSLGACAYLISSAPLYSYGSILAALYGIYGVLPFDSKLKKEILIYKLAD